MVKVLLRQIPRFFYYLPALWFTLEDFDSRGLDYGRSIISRLVHPVARQGVIQCRVSLTHHPLLVAFSAFPLQQFAKKKKEKKKARCETAQSRPCGSSLAGTTMWAVTHGLILFSLHGPEATESKSNPQKSHLY